MEKKYHILFWIAIIILIGFFLGPIIIFLLTGDEEVLVWILVDVLIIGGWIWEDKLKDKFS